MQKPNIVVYLSDDDGRSFKDVLCGQRTTFRDRIYSTHTRDGNMNVFPHGAFGIANINIF